MARSYAWARHVDALGIALSAAAREGLDYALRLAAEAEGRKRAMLDRDWIPPAFTIRDLADAELVTTQHIHARIRRLKEEVFGRSDLSDRAIYYRLRCGRLRPSRACRACSRQLPPDVPTNRRYCDACRSPAARTRRSRAGAGRSAGSG